MNGHILVLVQATKLHESMCLKWSSAHEYYLCSCLGILLLLFSWSNKICDTTYKKAIPQPTKLTAFGAWHRTGWESDSEFVPIPIPKNSIHFFLSK